MRKLIILIFSILCLYGCAKIVSPTGGPRDVTPPEITKEVPANGTTNFKESSIKITFNEFVTLDNPNEKVLISPPLSTPPLYSMSGKTLTIKIKDTLQPDQTYNFGFAECIKDFTEGNPIPFYNYAFSTGDRVDSMQLRGRVMDALTAQPVKSCFVMAYADDIDSLPLTTKPQFVSKTGNDGSFCIKNIKPGNYKIFALTDINNNLIFDLPNEKIAFSEQLHPARYIPTKKDTATADSTSIDTTEITDNQKDNIILQLFEEEDSTQVFVKVQNKEWGKYEFIYKNKINSRSARIMDGESLDYWEVIGSDTITWYLKQPLNDTLLVEMTVNDTVLDTLRLEPFKKKEKSNKRERETKSLTVRSENLGELYSPIRLRFPYPIRPAQDIDIEVVSKRKYTGNDTSHFTISIPDTFVMSLDLDIKLEEKVPYTLTIRDSVFQGYNGLFNDTIRLQFTSKSVKDYGSLRMTYELPESGYQYIVQLINSKSEVVKTDMLKKSTGLVYNNLAPGNYKIKVVEDRNGNGQWDTGNYRQKVLPERIIFFSKPITIRGYWELEEVFDLGAED